MIDEKRVLLGMSLRTLFFFPEIPCRWGLEHILVLFRGTVLRCARLSERKGTRCRVNEFCRNAYRNSRYLRIALWVCQPSALLIWIHLAGDHWIRECAQSAKGLTNTLKVYERLVSYFGVFPDRYIRSTVLTTCDNKLGGEEERPEQYFTLMEPLPSRYSQHYTNLTVSPARGARLRGHLSRSNFQQPLSWQHITEGSRILCEFSGCVKSQSTS